MISNLAPARSDISAASRPLRRLALIALFCGLTGVLLAQDDANATDNANGNARRGRRGQNGGSRANFDPAQMQERMMTAMREQFGVTDDAEWKLISDRITAVTELRRATAAGGFGGLGGFRGGGQGGGRAARGNNPELDSLRQAVTDKLPDAEIKSRLARLRDARKANEEKLSKAQEDLRAVLTVRQEAVAVMAGLLP